MSDGDGCVCQCGRVAVQYWCVCLCVRLLIYCGNKTCLEVVEGDVGLDEGVRVRPADHDAQQLARQHVARPVEAWGAYAQHTCQTFFMEWVSSPLRLKYSL